MRLFGNGLLRLALYVSAACIPVALHRDGMAQEVTAEQLADELPRIPPVEAERAIETMRVLPGFTLELVAHEPLVVDPVAFAFDARGRLWVVEMRGYSEQGEDHLGRIALLIDEDHDGRMDKRTDFVTGLSWPTAIWPWRDGALVAEPPRITWYRDTDGDGKADESEDWFTGFGRSNVQGLVNSFRWGVDCRIHGATSSAGADVRPVTGEDLDQTPMTLRRRDFVIDPVRRTMAPETGGGQHGLSFNCWGDKFVTSNSDHLQQVLELEQWLGRHPATVPLPPLRRSIAEDGPQAEVFRASPVEPWRIVRTRLRVAGVVPGPIEGGGKPAGYFTGATGTWIVDRDMLFGDPQYDTALVCDVGSNLVHRKRLIDHGLWFTGQRIDPGTELVRSTDIWFRPVQLGDGPDGAVYIADMYREVIEHPKSLPPMIKQHLDLTSGRDRGRIWRLRREGMPSTDVRRNTTMHQWSAEALVEALASPIAWCRRTASQQLIERYADGGAERLPDAASDRLRKLMFDTAQPVGQINALHVAARLGVVKRDDLAHLLADEPAHERVVEHALRVSRWAGWLPSDDRVWERLASTDDARVQLETAMLAAELPVEKRVSVLTGVAARADEDVVQAIVLVAAGDAIHEVLEGISRTAPPEMAQRYLSLGGPALIDRASTDQTARRWLIRQITAAEAATRRRWLAGVGQLDVSRRQRLLSWLTPEQLGQVQAFVQGLLVEWAERGKVDRAEVAALARLLPLADLLQLGKRWLHPEQDEPQQLAWIQSLRGRSETELARLLVERIPELTPRLRDNALQVLADRTDWSVLLLQAVQQGKVPASLIPADIRQRLRQHSDPTLQALLRDAFGSTSQDRETVIRRYAEALNQGGGSDALRRGQQVFAKHCAACHRLDGVGHEVGARLQQLADKTPEQLLVAILDPNREVDPRLVSYTILTDDDRVLTGIIREESGGQVVLVESGGTEHVIERASIVRISSQGQSLMPTGLEQQITPEEMAALIHYLRHRSGN